MGIGRITLKLWQLAALAVPLIILLVVQTAVMFLGENFRKAGDFKHPDNGLLT